MQPFSSMDQPIWIPDSSTNNRMLDSDEPKFLGSKEHRSRFQQTKMLSSHLGTKESGRRVSKILNFWV
ncbi:hypothetical protein SLEP1_g24342 [Rubroshorea leprosula]|uniref:Uncharacterized protein n=1 Tax=Rubroshorea leprosula TaxID=152421 RepID=A0AAV5JSJ3_9ROSI|nr:hypothetical protein SLEP1_g24342 [Rubroshorea leprosula]